MRRVDDDLDEMDVQLDKAQSQVNELGMGLVKGLAKDASNASRPKIFGLDSSNIIVMYRKAVVLLNERPWYPNNLLFSSINGIISLGSSLVTLNLFGIIVLVHP